MKLCILDKLKLFSLLLKKRRFFPSDLKLANADSTLIFVLVFPNKAANLLTKRCLRSAYQNHACLINLNLERQLSPIFMSIHHFIPPFNSFISILII